MDGSLVHVKCWLKPTDPVARTPISTCAGSASGGSSTGDAAANERGPAARCLEKRSRFPEARLVQRPPAEETVRFSSFRGRRVYRHRSVPLHTRAYSIVDAMAHV